MAISVEEKYKQERERRINSSKGLAQYLEKSRSASYILTEDPWIEPGTPINRPVSDEGHVKIVIFGAGFGGLCAAAQALLEGSASSPEDIMIVDYAGGFGGTWWHNRYPGLMCDVESYVYLPLLEETGYMPKRKYASGEEIRNYADILAQKFKIHDRAMFQSRGKALTWDPKTKNWTCTVAAMPKGADEFQVKFTADYVILASGGFKDPKVPDTPGLDKFQRKMLHTGRWNYQITGGSPANPVLSGLQGKKVALIGTGATAIQAVPATAKYAQELYVFQRTASAVDFRNNRDTDPEEWKTKIATKKGWQRERAENFQAFTEGTENLPNEDMVNDGMSNMPTLSGAWGGPQEVKSADTENWVTSMSEQDSGRSDKVRQRALDVVKDQETAKALQAWYPGWCKRPTFHDEYLEAFNQANVHLVDTAGKGIDSLTPTGISFDGKDYPIDVIIWSTGYSGLTESLAGKADMTVTGKDGHEMEDCSKNGKLTTLHGLSARHFPNMFLLGFSQAGVGVNQSQRLNEQSLHVANLIKQAEQKTGGKVAIEPSGAACEDWANQCASHAHKFTTMAGCLPSYFNAEGDALKMTPEQQAAAARNALWGKGYLSYAQILADWRATGKLEGLEMTAA